MTRQPWRLGLTGGIGSGKSTVGARLQALGAELIDADALSRQSTAAGGAAIEPIRAAFGDGFIDSHGALDRAAMRERVFKDATARQRLEAVGGELLGERRCSHTTDGIAEATRASLAEDGDLVLIAGASAVISASTSQTSR